MEKKNVLWMNEPSRADFIKNLVYVLNLSAGLIISGGAALNGMLLPPFHTDETLSSFDLPKEDDGLSSMRF
jgi:hypothetical protein